MAQHPSPSFSQASVRSIGHVKILSTLTPYSLHTTCRYSFAPVRQPSFHTFTHSHKYCNIFLFPPTFLVTHSARDFELPQEMIKFCLYWKVTALLNADSAGSCSQHILPSNILRYSTKCFQLCDYSTFSVIVISQNISFQSPIGRR